MTVNVIPGEIKIHLLYYKLLWYFKLYFKIVIFDLIGDLIGWQRKIGENKKQLTIVRKLAHFSLEIFLKLDQFFSNAYFML